MAQYQSGTTQWFSDGSQVPPPAPSAPSPQSSQVSSTNNANPPPPQNPPPPPSGPPPPPPPAEASPTAPNAAEEQRRLAQLQQQAQQWQQEKQWREYQEQLAQYHEQVFLQNVALTNTELSSALLEEQQFNAQYDQWKQQFEDWKKDNKNHPNKEQYRQYEAQWKQYESQMEGQRAQLLMQRRAVLARHAIQVPDFRQQLLGSVTATPSPLAAAQVPAVPVAMTQAPPPPPPAQQHLPYAPMTAAMQPQAAAAGYGLPAGLPPMMAAAQPHAASSYLPVYQAMGQPQVALSAGVIQPAVSASPVPQYMVPPAGPRPALPPAAGQYLPPPTSMGQPPPPLHTQPPPGTQGIQPQGGAIAAYPPPITSMPPPGAPAAARMAVGAAPGPMPNTSAPPPGAWPPTQLPQQQRPDQQVASGPLPAKQPNMNQVTTQPPAAVGSRPPVPFAGAHVPPPLASQGGGLASNVPAGRQGGSSDNVMAQASWSGSQGAWGSQQSSEGAQAQQPPPWARGPPPAAAYAGQPPPVTGLMGPPHASAGANVMQPPPYSMEQQSAPDNVGPGPGQGGGAFTRAQDQQQQTGPYSVPPPSHQAPGPRGTQPVFQQKPNSGSQQTEQHEQQQQWPPGPDEQPQEGSGGGRASRWQQGPSAQQQPAPGGYGGPQSSQPRAPLQGPPSRGPPPFVPGQPPPFMAVPPPCTAVPPPFTGAPPPVMSVPPPQQSGPRPQGQAPLGAKAGPAGSGPYGVPPPPVAGQPGTSQDRPGVSGRGSQPEGDQRAQAAGFPPSSRPGFGEGRPDQHHTTDGSRVRPQSMNMPAAGAQQWGPRGPGMPPLRGPRPAQQLDGMMEMESNANREDENYDAQEYVEGYEYQEESYQDEYYEEGVDYAGPGLPAGGPHNSSLLGEPMPARHQPRVGPLPPPDASVVPPRMGPGDPRFPMRPAVPPPHGLPAGPPPRLPPPDGVRPQRPPFQRPPGPPFEGGPVRPPFHQRPPFGRGGPRPPFERPPFPGAGPRPFMQRPPFEGWQQEGAEEWQEGDMPYGGEGYSGQEHYDTPAAYEGHQDDFLEGPYSRKEPFAHPDQWAADVGFEGGMGPQDFYEKDRFGYKDHQGGPYKQRGGFHDEPGFRKRPRFADGGFEDELGYVDEEFAQEGDGHWDDEGFGNVGRGGWGPRGGRGGWLPPRGGMAERGRWPARGPPQGFDGPPMRHFEEDEDLPPFGRGGIHRRGRAVPVVDHAHGHADRSSTQGVLGDSSRLGPALLPDPVGNQGLKELPGDRPLPPDVADRSKGDNSSDGDPGRRMPRGPLLHEPGAPHQSGEGGFQQHRSPFQQGDRPGPVGGPSPGGHHDRLQPPTQAPIIFDYELGPVPQQQHPYSRGPSMQPRPSGGPGQMKAEVIDYGHGRDKVNPAPVPRHFQRERSRSPVGNHHTRGNVSGQSPAMTDQGNAPWPVAPPATLPSGSAVPAPPPREPLFDAYATICEQETIDIKELIWKPGRSKRPARVCIIVRGPPGSGKTYVSKLIRDKEGFYGGSAPRILSLDDYFMVEVERLVNEDGGGEGGGRQVKKKMMEYEYEQDMEDSYRKDLVRTFKKTIEKGYFSFIIVDANNDKLKYFEEFSVFAKQNGFQVYVVDMITDVDTCMKRNTHNRSRKDIEKVIGGWEKTPPYLTKLDVRSLLQDDAITDVEMEDEPSSSAASAAGEITGKAGSDSAASSEQQGSLQAEVNSASATTSSGGELGLAATAAAAAAAAEEESDMGQQKSKWELETGEERLDKLDGLLKIKHHEEGAGEARNMEDFLRLPDDYDTRTSQPGKKRVRWADMEEKRKQDRERQLGFVVGHTNWERVLDDEYADKALARTKYI